MSLRVCVCECVCWKNSVLGDILGDVTSVRVCVVVFGLVLPPHRRPLSPVPGARGGLSGFGLLSDTFSELEEVEDHEWAGAADIAVGGARKPVRDDSATGQFRDVDDAEGWLDAS